MTQAFSTADNAQALTPKDIDIGDIYSDSTFNCRGPISPFDVRELADDIAVRGLQTPITVQPYTDMPPFKYRIVAGHRRHAACVIAGKKTIPAVVKHSLSETDAIVYNLTENLKRRDLNMLQEAQAIERLKMAGYSEKEVAEMVGMSRGWVQIRFQILELPDDIQKEIAAGVIKSNEIKTLATLPSVEQQLEMVRAMKDQRLLGKKKDVDPDKILEKTKNLKRPRTRPEMFAIQQVLFSVFGHTIAGSVLAWAQGEMDDLELHKAIQAEARDIGKYYLVPPHLES